MKKHLHPECTRFKTPQHPQHQKLRNKILGIPGSKNVSEFNLNSKTFFDHNFEKKNISDSDSKNVSEFKLNFKTFLDLNFPKNGFTQTPKMSRGLIWTPRQFFLITISILLMWKLQQFRWLPAQCKCLWNQLDFIGILYSQKEKWDKVLYQHHVFRYRPQTLGKCLWNQVGSYDKFIAHWHRNFTSDNSASKISQQMHLRPAPWLAAM